MKKVIYSAPFLPLEPLDKEAQTRLLKSLISQVEILNCQIDASARIACLLDKKGVYTSHVKDEMMYLKKQSQQMEERITSFYEHANKAYKTSPEKL